MQIYNRKKENIESNDAKPVLIKTPLSKVGFVLKESREKKSLTVRDIKELTHIPEHHISAIEAGARDRLPEDLFLTGFIRRYARALNLNDEILINKYFEKDEAHPIKSSETDAFDTLFENDNVIHLKTKNNVLKDDLSNTSFLHVYHFYMIIGVILFLIASILMFSSVSNNKKTEADSYPPSSINENFDESDITLEADFAYDEEELFAEADKAEDFEDEIVIEEPMIIENTDTKIVVNSPEVLDKPKVQPVVVAKPQKIEPIQKNKEVIKSKPEIVTFTMAIPKKQVMPQVVKPEKHAVEIIKPITIKAEQIILEKPKIEIIKSDPVQLKENLESQEIAPLKEHEQAIEPNVPLRKRIQIDTEVMLRPVRN